MTKNSFRGGARGDMQGGPGMRSDSQPPGGGSQGNVLGGLSNLTAGLGPLPPTPGGGVDGGAPNLMGPPTLQGGGAGPTGISTQDGIAPTGPMPPLPAPPPSLSGTGAQAQVDAAYGPPSYGVNQMGVPGLEGLAGGGVLKAKGVPQIPQG